MAYPILIAAIAIQTTRSPQNPVVPAAIALIGMPRAIEPSAMTGSMLSCLDVSAGRAVACASLASTRGRSCHHREGSHAAATETVTSCHTPPLTFRPFPVACPGAWSPT
jgi:hypothetical protein